MTTNEAALGDVGRAVAANIRRLRLAQGKSAQAVADETCTHGWAIDRHAIYKIEERGRRVTVDELVSLAAVFDVRPQDLLTPAAECPGCQGSPPSGFSCLTCGTSAPVERQTTGTETTG